MRILLIDDNPDVLEGLVMIVRGAGHEVETTGTVASAIEIHESRPVELLVTDIFMPDEDGFEAIDRFRSRWPAVKIVAMSGGGRVARGDYLSSAAAAGADAVLRKPFDPSRLLELIDQLGARP